jgi:hypothetical protein
VSPDTQLSKIGDRSKINYFQNFRSYKSFIVQKAHTPAMKATMAFFDKELFVGIRGSADHETVNEDLSDQLAAAMADFGIGEEDEGDDDDTAGADAPQHRQRLPPVERRTALRAISETEPPQAAHSQPSQRNSTPGPSGPRAAVIPTMTSELPNVEQNDDNQLPLPPAPQKKRNTRASRKGKEKATG